jgi:hypothetical protein
VCCVLCALQPLAPHGCKRPPFSECSEQEFLDDVRDFLQQRRGRSFDAAKFPDAVLNGSPLDLHGLYREVISRGGFRAGNGINWRGKVFSNMKNWTAGNRQTGVGNSLKKHYANYLWEYEQVREVPGVTHRVGCGGVHQPVHLPCVCGVSQQGCSQKQDVGCCAREQRFRCRSCCTPAGPMSNNLRPSSFAMQAHPQDVATDRCTICSLGEEAGATDWIACDNCNCWVHFSCDRRADLGTFASYSEGEGRSYFCPTCSASAALAAAAAAEKAGKGGAGSSQGEGGDPMEQG